jgi:hypothetical protein
VNAWDHAMKVEPRQYALHKRWGWAGIGVWTAFVLACEKHRGSVPFDSEVQLASDLRIGGLPLVDADGQPFTVAEFFRWTGERKWTRRHRGRWPAIEYRGWANAGRRAA